MNVLLVSSHGLPHVGGVEILVDKEVRALAAAGHSVVHLTSDLGGSGEVPVYPGSVRVVRVPSSMWLGKALGLVGPVFSPRLLPVLWRQAGQCDVVHAHGFLALNAVTALVIGRLRGRHCILTEHNGTQTRRSRFATILVRLAAETLGRLAVACAERCVTYNSRVMRQLQRFCHRGERVRFIPYPVDRSRFYRPTPEVRQAARQGLGWTADRPRVLFVGRLIAEKGIPLLLKAADPSYDLVFCGGGETAILGPLPRPGVEYQPPRPQDELVRLYHAADILVLPSCVEGFPLVAREALACGLRVLLAYEPGYEPYRGLPGLTFCARTPESIRQEILEALRASAPAERPSRNETIDLDPHEWIERIYGEPRATAGEAEPRRGGINQPRATPWDIGCRPTDSPERAKQRAHPACSVRSGLKTNDDS